MNLELGQRILDEEEGDHVGVIVARLDNEGNVQILPGYENKESLKALLFALADWRERLYWIPDDSEAEGGYPRYTWENDPHVTEVND